jgi:hypothetical protein
MEAPAMTPDPAVSADSILAAIGQLCEAYARAEVARTLAARAPDESVRREQLANGDYWQSATHSQFEALAGVVREALPPAVGPEQFLPIRTAANGTVELRALDTASRPVVVIFTGAEALTVGAHLTAHGAVTLDRIGAKVDAALPPVVRAVGFATTGSAPATPATAPVVPGPAH